jgi:hypothetical protein
MIFEIFSHIFLPKNWHFWLKTEVNYAKFWYNMGFGEKRQFFRRKLSKIVILTSTPDHKSTQSGVSRLK